MGFLIGLVVVVLVAFIAIAVCASRYYVGAFARATKLDFLAMVRSPKALLQHRLASRIGKACGKEGCDLLFNVRVPKADGTFLKADVVAVLASGVYVMSFMQGGGRVMGKAEEPSWLMVPSRRKDEGEYLIDNALAPVRECALALSAYLQMKGIEGVPVRAAVVCSPRMDCSGLDSPDVVGLKDAMGLFGASPDQAESGELDASARRQIARAVHVWALSKEAVAAATARDATAVAQHAFDTLRGAVPQTSRADVASADLIRRADRIVAEKGDFDGMAWDRVLEIGDRLLVEPDQETRADLVAELHLIARTSVSLSRRLGIPMEAAGTSAVNELAVGASRSAAEGEGGWSRSIVDEALRDADADAEQLDLDDSALLKGLKPRSFSIPGEGERTKMDY
jgi:hypothetical protein